MQEVTNNSCRCDRCLSNVNQRSRGTITEYQNNQGVREIASTGCPRRRLLMFHKSLEPVVFDSGQVVEAICVRLQNKYDFVSVGLER